MLTIYYIFLASIASLATAQNCSPGQLTYPGRGCFNSCPPGSRQTGNICLDCSPGTYTPGSGFLSCLSCSPGFIAPGAGYSSCFPCNAGQFSVGGVNCASCPSGSVSVPSSGNNFCSTCNPGTAPNSNQAFCLTCQAGTFSIGSQPSCTTCSSGTYSTDGASSCLNCATGSISNPGSSSCTPCPGGSVPTPDKQSCSTCARNTFSLGGTCAPCPAGSTSNPGSSFCTAQPIPSPVPRRRATTRQILDSLSCPDHLIPCADNWGKAKCVVPSVDLYTCGGCGKGYTGDPGRDCSVLDSFASAQCTKGKCVLSCPEEYRLEGEECILI